MNIGPGTMELVPENPQLNYEPEKWSCYCSKCVLGHLMCNLLHTGHINMDLVPKKPQEHYSQSECSCSLTKMRFNSSFVQKNIYNLHWTFGVRALNFWCTCVMTCPLNAYIRWNSVISAIFKRGAVARWWNQLQQQIRCTGSLPFPSSGKNATDSIGVSTWNNLIYKLSFQDQQCRLQENWTINVWILCGFDAAFVTRNEKSAGSVRMKTVNKTER